MYQYNSPSARYPAQAVSLNTQYITPMYDFSGYHPVLGDPSATAWNPVYYNSRDEYPYGSSPGAAAQVSFSSPELSGTPTAADGGSFTPSSFNSGQDLLFSRWRPHESITSSVSGGKTRTKDKYRVVYSDKQRLGLEREFQYNHYITMRRKTELSVALGLSERQVKIWFQNRRAKERKENRRKLQHCQQASTTTPCTTPELGRPADTHADTSPNSNILLDTVSEEY